MARSKTHRVRLGTQGHQLGKVAEAGPSTGGVDFWTQIASMWQRVRMAGRGRDFNRIPVQQLVEAATNRHLEGLNDRPDPHCPARGAYRPVIHGRDARATMASWHGRPGHDTNLDRFVNFVSTKWTYEPPGVSWASAKQIFRIAALRDIDSVGEPCQSVCEFE